MLELLWVTDKEEVYSPTVAPTHLGERWSYLETGYSPFGIGFCRSQTGENIPFETWAYCPAYLPPNLQIDIASSTNSHEPLLFVIPFGVKNHNQPVNHPSGIRKVTDIRIIIPSSEPFSNAINIIQQQGLVKFLTGTENLLTIEFDRAIQKQAMDFRPDLPLRFYW